MSAGVHRVIGSGVYGEAVAAITTKKTELRDEAARRLADFRLPLMNRVARILIIRSGSLAEFIFAVHGVVSVVDERTPRSAVQTMYETIERTLHMMPVGTIFGRLEADHPEERPRPLRVYRLAEVAVAGAAADPTTQRSWGRSRVQYRIEESEGLLTGVASAQTDSVPLGADGSVGPTQYGDAYDFFKVTRPITSTVPSSVALGETQFGVPVLSNWPSQESYDPSLIDAAWAQLVVAEDQLGVPRR